MVMKGGRELTRLLGENAVADAKLMAAAPELLDALEKALGCLDEDDFPNIAEMCKNALAKAKGI
jgi:hypothetical protein